MKLTVHGIHNGMLATKHTCDGDNLSPRIEWRNIPEHTKSLALIVDDPDAPTGTFTHWILYNISVEHNDIEEGGMVKGAGEGMNDFHKTGFGGACPPRGDKEHHYSFRLYALDKVLDLQSPTTKGKLEAAMKDHIIAQAEVIGTYKRT